MAGKRHKLPLKTALKMGLSVKRPVRFCLTVLLAAVAFGMTGLAALVGFYDESRAKVQTYVQFCDVFSLYAEQALTYDTVGALSSEWGLPCGALSSANAFCDGGEEAANAMYSYMVQHRVHAVMQVQIVGCFDEEVLSAEGVELLAGKSDLSGREVLISSCFANGLLAAGVAAEEESLIGREIVLAFPDKTAVSVAGIYQNDGCFYAEKYAETEGMFSSYGPCEGIEPYTGALFVSRDFYQTLAKNVDVGYFAGDGFAATGAKVRDFLDSHGEYRSELFLPFSSLREDIAKAAGIFGAVGGALAAFSALMIFQFINISIDGKRQMIGILRALGGSRADVVTVFLLESGMLGICGALLAVALASALVPPCNLFFSSFFGVKIALVAHQPLVLCGVFFLCLAVALLSALFPVLREAKKRPVDVIKFAEE